jgi:hypothetical protein
LTDNAFWIGALAAPDAAALLSKQYAARYPFE